MAAPTGKDRRGKWGKRRKNHLYWHYSSLDELHTDVYVQIQDLPNYNRNKDYAHKQLVTNFDSLKKKPIKLKKKNTQKNNHYRFVPVR